MTYNKLYIKLFLKFGLRSDNVTFCHVSLASESLMSTPTPKGQRSAFFSYAWKERVEYLCIVLMTTIPRSMHASF